MAKGNGTTRTVGSSSASAPRTSRSDGFYAVRGMDNVYMKAQYNAYSGDEVYSIEYQRLNNTEIEQLRIHREADTDGYRKVELPYSSNQDVTKVARMILGEEHNLKIDIKVGDSRDEMHARNYGFVADEKPTREDDGSYWRTYRKK